MSRSLKIAVLQVSRLFGLFWLSRRLTRSKIRILCYHGGSIGDESQFNPLLFCARPHLASRVDWLVDKGFSFVSLSDAIPMLDQDTARPALPVVLTFDDGWYSTLKELHPVLHARALPATLYLSTQYHLAGLPNTEVVIRYIIWKSSNANVRVEGFGSTEPELVDLTRPEERDRLATRVQRWIEGSCSGREATCTALEQFAAQLAVSQSDLDLASRQFDFLRADELKQLATQGWSIELHGHVHQYPVGRPAELLSDIEQCQRTIDGLGLPSATHYCYPSGEFDNNAHVVLRNAGVVSATTCWPGLVTWADDRQRYYLSRFLDGEGIHLVEFEAEMSGFADLLRRLAGRR